MPPRYRTAHTLTEAIHRENWERVEVLIRMGADPNQQAPTHSKDTSLPMLPLTMAVRKGNEPLVRQLIQAGAKPNGLGSYVLPLSEAIHRERLDLVKALVELGADVHAKASSSFSYGHLEEACSRPCPEIAAYLMGAGVRPRARKDGSTLLHLVMGNRRMDPATKTMVRLLLDEGVNPLSTAKVSSGEIHPSTYAALHGDAEVMQWFLDAGADPNLVNHYPMSNLDVEHLSMAAIVILRGDPGRAQVLQTLMAHGADLNARVDFNLHTVGMTAHMHGQAQKHPGFGSNDQRLCNMSLLALAGVVGHADCVSFLLEHGLSADDQGDKNTSVLHAVAKAAANNPDKPHFHETLQLLLAAGANPNALDHLGNTPLHYLADRVVPHASVKDERWKGLIRMLETMLDHGADPELANEKGVRPLDVARTNVSANDGFELLLSYADKLSMERSTPGATAVVKRARI